MMLRTDYTAKGIPLQGERGERGRKKERGGGKEREERERERAIIGKDHWKGSCT
jgi:hypothetical protein